MRTCYHVHVENLSVIWWFIILFPNIYLCNQISYIHVIPCFAKLIQYGKNYTRIITCAQQHFLAQETTWPSCRYTLEGELLCRCCNPSCIENWHLSIFGKSTCPKIIRDVQFVGTKTSNDNNKSNNITTTTSNVCVSCLLTTTFV
jgi:hypothetical protein